jgi:hypothetical protein
MWPLTCETTRGRCWARTSDPFLVRDARRRGKRAWERTNRPRSRGNGLASIAAGYQRCAAFHGLRRPGDGLEVLLPVGPGNRRRRAEVVIARSPATAWRVCAGPTPGSQSADEFFDYPRGRVRKHSALASAVHSISPSTFYDVLSLLTIREHFIAQRGTTRGRD